MRKTSKMMMIEDITDNDIEKALLTYYGLHSQREIARAIKERTGITVSPNTIKNWLQKLKIPQRNRQETYQRRNRKNGDTIKQSQARNLIDKTGLEELLSALYMLGLSKNDIAYFFFLLNEQVGGDFSVSANTIESWLKEKTACSLRNHSIAVAMPFRRRKISEKQRRRYNLHPEDRLFLSQLWQQRKRTEKDKRVFCIVLKEKNPKTECQTVQRQFLKECKKICPLFNSRNRKE